MFTACFYYGNQCGNSYCKGPFMEMGATRSVICKVNVSEQSEKLKCLKPLQADGFGKGFRGKENVKLHRDLLRVSSLCRSTEIASEDWKVSCTLICSALERGQETAWELDITYFLCDKER